MNKISNKEILAMSVALLTVGTATVSLLSKLKKIKAKSDEENFEKDCMYMAYMDDEVGRREWNGKTINGDVIKFPPKRESFYYRYQLFKEMFSGVPASQREKELRKLEQKYFEYKVNHK